MLLNYLPLGSANAVLCFYLAILTQIVLQTSKVSTTLESPTDTATLATCQPALHQGRDDDHSQLPHQG
jgi:hypothetical protein